MEVTKWLKPSSIACHELVSLDFRCGSQPEVSNGHKNVRFGPDFVRSYPNFGHSEGYAGLPLMTHSGSRGSPIRDTLYSKA